MKKLALCFLVYNRIECEKIWKIWLNGNEDRVNIYVHSKRPFFTQLNNVYHIPTIPTQWGTFSLVEATLNLFEEALKDDSNSYFLLMSHNSIPLKTFDIVYNTLISEEKSYCNILVSDSTRLEYFTKTLPDSYRLPEHIMRHSQWISLSRKHAQFLIDKKREIQEIFSNSEIPDEFFLYYLFSKNDMTNELINKQIHYVSWREITDAHPYTIYLKTISTIKHPVQNPDYLFGRKFSICTFRYNSLDSSMFFPSVWDSN